MTDFLASHNINANQIRQDANARRAAANASRAAEGDEDNEDDGSPVPEKAPARKNETKTQAAKRKAEEEVCSK